MQRHTYKKLQGTVCWFYIRKSMALNPSYQHRHTRNRGYRCTINLTTNHKDKPTTIDPITLYLIIRQQVSSRFVSQNYEIICIKPQLFRKIQRNSDFSQRNATFYTPQHNLLRSVTAPISFRNPPTTPSKHKRPTKKRAPNHRDTLILFEV